MRLLKKHAVFCLSVIFALLLLTGCSAPKISRTLNETATDTISYTAYTPMLSKDDILNALVTTMRENETVCYFSVSDESLIDADFWLSSLQGINEIHCEYRKIKNGFNVAVTLSYWDNYAIVNAYVSNDLSLLNDRQTALYEKYLEILSECTASSKTPAENELAIHDYLVTHIEYVDDITSKYDAYDALINGRSVCSGYAECFKTLLDMLQIESTTISGTANNEAHIWNLVHLENSWYQVDVTWDDPVGNNNLTGHEYFNITDADMAMDHIWDASGYPEASGTAYNYAAIAGLHTILSQNDLGQYLPAVIHSHPKVLEFIVPNNVASTIDLRLAIEKCDVNMSYSYKITERSTYTIYNIRFNYTAG